MTITKEEAIQTAVNLLSSRIKNRLEIVDRISGIIYMPTNIDFKNSWIIHVKSEESILDGQEQYVVVDKKTGIMTEVTTN
jgi:hypothetical protein